jgi:hypothetical protein
MKTIRTDGEAKLVETRDHKRHILPVDSDEIDLAIPYGLPWEDFTQHPAIPGKFRQAGIYTYQDLMEKHEAALGAIQAAYGQDLQTIMILARKYGGHTNG